MDLLEKSLPRRSPRQTSIQLGLLFSSVICFCSPTLAQQNWDALLQNIDPYAQPEKKQTPQQAPSSSQIQHSKKTTPSKNAVEEAIKKQQEQQQVQPRTRTPQVEYRARNRGSLNNNLNNGVSFFQPSEPSKPPPTKLTLSHIKQKKVDSLEDYSFQKTRFNWGLKQRDYEYQDYEISFDPRQRGHAKALMGLISQMTLEGWEMDESRETQELNNKNADDIKITTHSKLRFKRKRE